MDSIYEYKRRMDWVLAESAYVFSPHYEARNHNLWLFNADAEDVDEEGFTPRADVAEPHYEKPPEAAETPLFLWNMLRRYLLFTDLPILMKL